MVQISDGRTRKRPSIRLSDSRRIGTLHRFTALWRQIGDTSPGTQPEQGIYSKKFVSTETQLSPSPSPSLNVSPRVVELYDSVGRVQLPLPFLRHRQERAARLYGRQLPPRSKLDWAIPLQNVHRAAAAKDEAKTSEAKDRIRRKKRTTTQVSRSWVGLGGRGRRAAGKNRQMGIKVYVRSRREKNSVTTKKICWRHVCETLTATL